MKYAVYPPVYLSTEFDDIFIRRIKDFCYIYLFLPNVPDNKKGCDEKRNTIETLETEQNRTDE